MAAKIGKLLSILVMLPLFISCPTSVTKYNRIVLDTYEPNGGLPLNIPADTYLILYDSSGNLLAENDDGNTDANQNGSSRINHTSGLTSGTYYLKVTKGPTSNNIGPYAVRALSLAPAEAIPSYPSAFDVPSDPYEGQDGPEAAPPLSIQPVQVPLNDGKGLGRKLDTLTDVDWLEFTLP